MNCSASDTDIIEGFWQNAHDSLHHALDHLMELYSGSKRDWHHHKWLIFSVDHAATCLGCMWLKEIEPGHALFKKKGGRFPSFKELVPVLGNHLSEAEHKLIGICSEVNEIRDQLMHRPAPKEIDKNEVSLAAMAMSGIIRVVANRKNTDFYSLFGEFPENRKAIFDAIHYRKHPEYERMVESLLTEHLPHYRLEQCPECGARAAIGSDCEACFEDLSSATCQHCEAEFLVSSHNPANSECPECGASI